MCTEHFLLHDINLRFVALSYTQSYICHVQMSFHIFTASWEFQPSNDPSFENLTYHPPDLKFIPLILLFFLSLQSYILKHIIESEGWQLSYVFCAALSLQFCVFGSLFFPRPRKTTISIRSEDNPLRLEEKVDISYTEVPVAEQELKVQLNSVESATYELRASDKHTRTMLSKGGGYQNNSNTKSSHGRNRNTRWTILNSDFQKDRLKYVTFFTCKG